VATDGKAPVPSGPAWLARPSSKKQHVTVRAMTACRLAILPRAQLDSQALLGVAAEQRSRQDSVRRTRDDRA
jgi:hypothetical protein